MIKIKVPEIPKWFIIQHSQEPDFSTIDKELMEEVFAGPHRELFSFGSPNNLLTVQHARKEPLTMIKETMLATQIDGCIYRAREQDRVKLFIKWHKYYINNIIKPCYDNK